MCVQCVVIVDCRVSAVYLRQLLPKNWFAYRTKLALQNKHFSAQNALKRAYRHLGFQKKKFPGVTIPDPTCFRGRVVNALGRHVQ